MGRGMEKGVVSLSPACGRSVIVLCWHCVIVPRRCHLVFSRRRRCASSRGFAVACWRVVVPRSCRVVVPWSPCRPPVLSSCGSERRQMLFVVWLSVREVGTSVVVRRLVATSPSATWHLDSTWSFSSVDGRLGSWAVVWVCERPLALVGGGVRCTSLWALGAVWWLSSAASL